MAEVTLIPVEVVSERRLYAHDIGMTRAKPPSPPRRTAPARPIGTPHLGPNKFQPVRTISTHRAWPIPTIQTFLDILLVRGNSGLHLNCPPLIPLP